MRRSGYCAILLLGAWGIPGFAQQTTPPQPPDSGAQNSAQAAAPLTPAQQLDQQIREVDPLDRPDDKDAKAKEKKRQQEEPPTPGSIAASERDAAARQLGPQVVTGDEAAEEPVQEYTGPAVLSRSYSVSRPLIPQQLKWIESIGVNTVYDTGVTGGVNTNGSISSNNLLGTMLNWAFSGRRYFHRDQLGVKYAGNYYQYPGTGGYNGSNNTLTMDYEHVLTRRMSVNLAFTGTMYSQNYTLGNEYLGPETTVANINLASSPNIQITDEGAKQLSTQTDFVWQKSARLSFDLGGSFFAISRDDPALLGMTGEQARGDMNYRLTRKMTVGGYYSSSFYVYPHGFGNSHTNTFGGIYSYAITRTLQVRLRAGVSRVDSLGLQVIAVAPAIAALEGVGSGMIDVTSGYFTTDVSAQVVKDFRRGKTMSLSYAHGIAPGNGIFQTSVQESIALTFNMSFFRKNNLSAAFGRDTLDAVSQALGAYQSIYGRISFSRTLAGGVSGNFSATLRHFELAQYIGVRNQMLLSAGVSWGSQNGRLWPF